MLFQNVVEKRIASGRELHPGVKPSNGYGPEALDSFYSKTKPLIASVTVFWQWPCTVRLFLMNVIGY